MTPIFTGEVFFATDARLMIDNPSQIATIIDELIDDYPVVDQTCLADILSKINVPYLSLTLVDADTEQPVDELSELFHIGVTLNEHYPFSLRVH